MNVQDLPAVMTVDTAARFLRICRLAAEEAVEAAICPVVIIDGQQRSMGANCSWSSASI